MLPHLSGYANSHPVRIGNAAYYQVQNDSIGYLLDIIYKYISIFQATLDEVEEIWEIIKNLVRAVLARGRSPTGASGNTGPGKAFCFLKGDELGGGRQGIAHCRAPAKRLLCEKWRNEADMICAEVHEKGWTKKCSVSHRHMTIPIMTRRCC